MIDSMVNLSRIANDSVMTIFLKTSIYLARESILDSSFDDC